MDKHSPCQQTLDQICDVLEFSLGHEKGKEACQELIAHIKSCPKCCAEVDTLQKTIKIFKEIPDKEVPNDVQWRLMKELHLDIPLRPESGYEE